MAAGSHSTPFSDLVALRHLPECEGHGARASAGHGPPWAAVFPALGHLCGPQFPVGHVLGHAPAWHDHLLASGPPGNTPMPCLLRSGAGGRGGAGPALPAQKRRGGGLARAAVSPRRPRDRARAAPSRSTPVRMASLRPALPPCSSASEEPRPWPLLFPT